MKRTKDLGRRIELLSMDPLCQDISVALYRQVLDGTIAFLVHTYSEIPEAEGRIAEIRTGLISRAGLVAVDGKPELLRFPCGDQHVKAIRRTFLEVCKLRGDELSASLPLVRFDKKADCDVTVVPEGGGGYRVTAPETVEQGRRRCEAVARGFVKLCEMESDETDDARIAFTCGCDHDELMGTLMFRAQNVRSAMKEDALAASRGTLAAPGSQESGV